MDASPVNLFMTAFPGTLSLGFILGVILENAEFL